DRPARRPGDGRPTAAPLHHARAPPPAVPALASLRRRADAGRCASAGGLGADHPARRLELRLRVRAPPPPAPRPGGGAERRRDRARPRGPGRRWLDGPPAAPARGGGRAPREPRHPGRAVGGARARALRPRADRALHARRPLRDAGDDPERAAGRAGPGAGARAGPAGAAPARAPGTGREGGRMTRGRGLGGRRVLITGAARGIGALLASRLHERGARVALLGLEPDELERVAADCGGAPWIECDVTERGQGEEAVAQAVERLGGLDVAVANAGVAAQMTLLDGDPEVWDATVGVNLDGTYNFIRASSSKVAHPCGYFLITASLAAAFHLPLMAAYCASKSAVDALGDSLRIELRPSGARVGVAYYAELATDMTAR